MSLTATSTLARRPGTRSNRLLSSLSLLLGIVLLLSGVWTAAVIALTLLWDQGWLRFRRTRLARWLGRYLAIGSHRLAQHLLKDERNAPYLYTVFGVGLLAPTLFLAALWGQSRLSPGWFWLMAYGYYVVLMGPYMRFFAYTATMAHKEGHEHRGLFKPRYRVLNAVFGYFIGIFYGHVPESYPVGHLRIHHKYDNGFNDVISTLRLDRTRPVEWLVYLPQFALYWTGISIVTHFWKRGKRKLAWRMLRGMLLFYGLMAVCMVYNLSFGVAFLLLPHLGTILLLAAVGYTWHAFVDPTDLENAYIGSVTIIDGQYNIFNEDFHVEHHMHPQMHWTDAERHYNEQLDQYRAHMATIFRETQTFELFVWIILRRYELMADHFVDLTGTLSQEEKIALLKSRMQAIPEPASERPVQATPSPTRAEPGLAAMTEA